MKSPLPMTSILEFTVSYIRAEYQGIILGMGSANERRRSIGFGNSLSPVWFVWFQSLTHWYMR